MTYVRGRVLEDDLSRLAEVVFDITSVRSTQVGLTIDIDASSE